MSLLLEYFKSIRTAEGFTLSVDKVAVDYMMKGPDALEALGRLLNHLPIRYAVNVRSWETFRIGSFRQNHTVMFQNGNSFWLGVALNSTKTEWNRVRLEVNPNKCAVHASFLAVLAFLNFNTRPMHTAIKRFDLAVDIPVERENAKLVKDGRVYSERRHGKEWTEYLGAQASHIGRVKFYNKQTEAGLSYPLTRLEVTLDPATPFEKIPWPQAYYIQRQQVDMAELNITDTERYILSALLAGFGSTKELCRKTREKMERLMSHYVRSVQISKHDYDCLLSSLRFFLTCPEKSVDRKQIDPDQPLRKGVAIPSWVVEAEKSPIEANVSLG